VVSGGDFAVSKRYRGVRPSGAPPDSMEMALIKGRISQLNEAREADPKDTVALEELAVSYAQLFDFPKAAELLDELVKSKPNDPEAWRLLGETTLLSQEPSRSARAYERAAKLTRDSDVQVLTGLVDAYIANAEPAKAVDYIKKIMNARDAGATTDPSSNADAKADLISVDSVALDLLLAKTYNGWNGHDNDAIAVYDALVKKNPTDFRGYLAKGLFLKDHGQKAEAERMFIQAQFYAPKSRQAFVRSMKGESPILELPSSD
jgi:Flp pilus assembly protein TadD